MGLILKLLFYDLDIQTLFKRPLYKLISHHFFTSMVYELLGIFLLKLSAFYFAQYSGQVFRQFVLYAFIALYQHLSYRFVICSSVQFRMGRMFYISD